MRSRLTTLALLLAGCALPAKQTGIPELERPALGARESGTEEGAPRAGFLQKLVAAKEEPSRLVAEDGTTCVVDAGRFARITIGQRAWCTWTDSH